MKYQEVQKKKIPDTPGVYFFRGAHKKILYIGKATSLRGRVRSYFTQDVVKSRGPLIRHMLEEARSIDYEKTDSVLEALLLEAHLIKKHKPKYNTEGKDDKSFNYVVIMREDFPRILIVRGRDILKKKFSAADIKYTFGPFPQSGVFKEAMKIVRKIFPFRDEKCKARSGKPCFNRHIGLCPGVCTGEISKKEYARTVQHLRMFFEGKKKTLITKLEKEMKEYAKEQKFEKAHAAKKTIFALNHIQDIALLKSETLSRRILSRSDLDKFYQGPTLIKGRIEGYDVAHMGGAGAVGVMVVVEGGEVKKSDYRKFKIKGEKNRSDTDSLKEILCRRLNHDEWQLPRIIVVDGGKAQLSVARKVLDEYGLKIPIVSVVKNEQHRPREILGDKRFRTSHEREILLANSEAHRFALQYHRQLRIPKV